MANGIYDLAALDKAFHVVYDPKIQNIIPEGNYLLESLEEGDVEAFRGGQGLEWLVKTQPNTSYGIGLDDGGELPAPGRRTEVLARTNVIDHRASTGLTQAAIDRAKRGEAAFYSVLDECQKEVVTDLRTKVGTHTYKQQIWPVVADSVGTTVTLGTVQYIQVGDKLAFGNRSTGAGATKRTVVSKDQATNTIVVDTAVPAMTAAASGAWYPGAGPDAAVKVESLALAAGTNRVLHGIDSTVVHGWNGNTLDLAGAVADEDDFGFILDQIAERQQGKVTDALATFGILRRFAKQMQSSKRFANGEAVKLRGGYTALWMDDVPLVAQPDVPKGYTFLYDRKAAKLIKGDAGFDKTPGDGTIWRRQISPNNMYTTGFEATYRYQLNVIFNTPGAIGSLTRCQDDKPPADM